MFLVIAMSLDNKTWTDVVKKLNYTREKLQAWYWHSLFSNAYKRTTSKITVVIQDIPELIAFMKQDAEWDADNRFNEALTIAGYSNKEALTEHFSATLEKAIASFVLSDPDLEDFPYIEKGTQRWVEKKSLSVVNAYELDHIFAYKAYKNRNQSKTIPGNQEIIELKF